jgi:thiamine biosynthesis protein ThiS
MKLTINGRQEEVSEAKTLGDLLRQRGLYLATVVAERNSAIVAHAALDETELEPGDKIELVSMVGGG